jgi:hypothetical protein
MAQAKHYAANKRFASAHPALIIRRLDRKIDANRRELRRRAGLVWPYTYIDAGHAWERFPELHRRERNLFWLRGEFQIHRNRQDYEREVRASRAAARSVKRKLKPCKACGGTGVAQAA